ARQPQLMLLDEPFSALDTSLRASTRKAVARVLDAARMTTILVTHDQIEALSFADQVAVLREGRLLQVGPPSELYLHPSDPLIAEFMGHAVALPSHLGDGFADCALGRIPIENCDRRGTAQIMLRPEQVKFVAVSERGSQTIGESWSCLGKVVEIEFGGSTCTGAGRLLGAAGEIGTARGPRPLLASPIPTPRPA